MVAELEGVNMRLLASLFHSGTQAGEPPVRCPMEEGGRAEMEVYVTSFGPLDPAVCETTPGVSSYKNRHVSFFA